MLLQQFRGFERPCRNDFMPRARFTIGARRKLHLRGSEFAHDLVMQTR